MRGLSLVAASRGHSSSRCAGLSLSRPLLLRSTGSRCAGSVIVAHGPSCSAACGILPDQASNPCPLYWQEDSQPLRHQGSPIVSILKSRRQRHSVVKQLIQGYTVSLGARILTLGSLISLSAPVTATQYFCNHLMFLPSKAKTLCFP